MGEKIEVYFKNANDAESALAQLRTIKINEVNVEEMPQDTDNTLFVPVFQSTTAADSSSSGVGTGSGNVAPIIMGNGNEINGPDYPNYLLQVEVEPKDYDQVMSILKNHDCYTRKDA